MRAIFHKHRQQEINALSATMAMGWTALLNGFAGSDSDAKRLTPHDFLPFDFSKTAEVKQHRKVSEATHSIIEQLLNSNALPPTIASAFLELLEPQKA